MAEEKMTDVKREVLETLADAWPLLSDEERGRLKGYGEAVADLRENYERELERIRKSAAAETDKVA